MSKFTKVNKSGEYIDIFAYETARKYLQYKLDEIDACEKLQISIGGEDFFDDFHDYLEAHDKSVARAVGLTEEEINSVVYIDTDSVHALDDNSKEVW